MSSSTSSPFICPLFILPFTLSTLSLPFYPSQFAISFLSSLFSSLPLAVFTLFFFSVFFFLCRPLSLFYSSLVLQYFSLPFFFNLLTPHSSLFLYRPITFLSLCLSYISVIPCSLSSHSFFIPLYPSHILFFTLVIFFFKRLSIASSSLPLFVFLPSLFLWLHPSFQPSLHLPSFQPLSSVMC